MDTLPSDAFKTAKAFCGRSLRFGGRHTLPDEIALEHVDMKSQLFLNFDRSFVVRVR
jgi:hypothetical protein